MAPPEGKSFTDLWIRVAGPSKIQAGHSAAFVLASDFLVSKKSIYADVAIN